MRVFEVQHSPAGPVLQELVGRLRPPAAGHGEGEQGVLEQGRGHPDGEAQGGGGRRAAAANSHVLSGTPVLIEAEREIERGHSANVWDNFVPTLVRTSSMQYQVQQRCWKSYLFCCSVASEQVKPAFSSQVCTISGQIRIRIPLRA